MDRYSDRSGFSLIELIIVIAIIAIALSMATMNFRAWSVKNHIEKQTRELFSDINEARIRSLYRKQNHSIRIVGANSYSFMNYSTENESTAAGRSVFTKSVLYQITSPAAGTNIMFNVRGALYTGVGSTIIIGPPNSGAFDCIVIDDVRTNMGKITNGTCVQQ